MSEITGYIMVCTACLSLFGGIPKESGSSKCPKCGKGFGAYLAPLDLAHAYITQERADWLRMLNVEGDFRPSNFNDPWSFVEFEEDMIVALDEKWAKEDAERNTRLRAMNEKEGTA